MPVFLFSRARPRFERSEHGFLRKKLSKVPRFTGNAYPDASDWSISDVVDFFVSAGFSEQAEAFRDQVGILFDAFIYLLCTEVPLTNLNFNHSRILVSIKKKS